MKERAKDGVALGFAALVVILGPLYSFTHPMYSTERNLLGRWMADQGGLLADTLTASELFVAGLTLFAIGGVLLDEVRDRI